MKIDNLLTLFKNKTTLILSDMYPPFVVGGAEISLQLQISCLNEDTRKKILVVIFSDLDQINISRIDSVDVVSIPTQRYWHKNQSLSFLYKYYKGSNKVYKYLVRFLARILNCINLGKIKKRLNIIYLTKFSRVKGGISKEILPEHRKEDYLYLKKIITSLPIKKILCNNTRSITLASRLDEDNPEIWQALAKYAYVRDQRFSCVRHNQAFYTNEKLCKSCDFKCTNEDISTKHRKHLKIYLKSLRDFRQNALNKFDNIFVSSIYSANLVNQFIDKSISVLGNPIENQEFIYQKTCDSFQDPQNIILIVGSLSEPKGQFEFIKNSVDFLKENPSYIIYFAGRGPRMQKVIEIFAKRENISNQILFKGFIEREKVYELMTLSSVIVGTSISPESFGRIPFECASVNRPYVGFNVGAIPENVPEKMLAPYGDYEALHKLIKNAINNKAQSRKNIELYKKDLLINNQWQKIGKTIFKKAFEN